MIATAPLVRAPSPPPQQASPAQPMPPAGSSRPAAAAVPPPRAAPVPPPPPSVAGGDGKRKAVRKSGAYVSEEELDAGLGLLDPVLDTAEDGDDQVRGCMNLRLLKTHGTWGVSWAWPTGGRRARGPRQDRFEGEAHEARRYLIEICGRWGRFVGEGG